MLYDKENGTVRTTKVICFFKQIAVEIMVSDETKKGNLLQDCLLSNDVGMDTESSNQISKDLEQILNA